MALLKRHAGRLLTVWSGINLQRFDVLLILKVKLSVPPGRNTCMYDIHPTYAAALPLLDACPMCLPPLWADDCLHVVSQLRGR